MAAPTILSVEEVAMVIAGLNRILTDEPKGSVMLAQWKASMVPYLALRNRLKASVGMGFYDNGANWLDGLLRNEREATLGKLAETLRAAIEDPATNRRTLRELLGRTGQDLIHGGRQWHDRRGWVDKFVAEQKARPWA